MKKIRIISIKYENFKGGSESLSFNGSEAAILGTNRAGKTRALDAWDWLLTDKDSSDSAQFGIKPVAGLKPTAVVMVEAAVVIDDETHTIKKEHAEKWTTKRGYSKPEFTGHTTECFIDGSPVGQKGFSAFLEKLCPIEILPCFTNLRYFNERLDCVPTEGKKKKLSTQEARRLVLIDAFGDISDADVIASDPEFARLPGMLGKKTAAEYRGGLDYRKTKLNEERRELPARIDELQKSLPDDPAEKRPDAGALAIEKTGIESRLSILRNELSMVESGGAAGAKKSELLDIQNKIREIEQAALKKADEESTRLRGVVRFCQDAYDVADKKATTLKMDLPLIQNKIDAFSEMLADLKSGWRGENAKVFTSDGICPTCGQMIPDDKVEEARGEFNLKKAEALSSIKAQGDDIDKKRKAAQEHKAKLEADIAEVEGKLPGLLSDLNKAKNNALIGSGPLAPSMEHQGFLDKAATIEKELSDIALGNRDATSGIYAEISEQEAALSGINGKLAEIDQHKKTMDRIDELLKREKELSAEWERMEADLILMENFTRAKCRMLTDKINSHFKHTRWMMFENQVNGGLKDVCVAMAQNDAGQWVQWQDLNTESRVNVSIDCINTLSGVYGLEMPIWIDDADLVVETIPTKSQTIKLLVSAEDKKLRVELENNDAAAAA